MNDNRDSSLPTLFALPAVGSTLLVLAGLSFMMVCMTLPLVGPAGAAVPWAEQNFRTFLSILLLTLILGGLSLVSKLMRRRLDGSPFPRASAALTGLCLFLLVALLTGLLKI